MTALPSFVELMDSLGLDSPKQTPPSIPQQSDFPIASPSIIVSEHDPDADRHSPRLHVARYSPYSAPISHSHRRSSSSLSNDGNDPERSERAVSASPCLSARIMGHRPVALKLGADSRHSHVASESEMTNMPISTFVRRKTPQSSPVSPTFARRTRTTRKRSQSPKLPVSIPTLPSVLFQSRPDTPEEPPSSPHQSDDDVRLTPDYPTEYDQDSSSYIREEDLRWFVPPIG